MPFDNVDKPTVRYVDQDGRLHVRISPITKANVCPYRGNEVVGWRELGLDPDRIYYLLRDPEELKKGAETFNNLQILSKHQPVDIHEPAQEITVGSTGTDAKFDGTYVTNSLVFWEGDAIAGIETNQVRQLSSAYYYRADMTPGTFRGANYDGVMRDIRGNHIALVEDGRAGSDVLVMDEALNSNTEKEMPTAKKVKLSPRLQAANFALNAFASGMAQDSKKVPSFTAMLSGIEGNWAKQKPIIAKNASALIKKSMAMDASVDTLTSLLNGLEGPGGVGRPEGGEVESNNPEDTGLGDPEDTNTMVGDDDLEAKIRELLQGKLDDADVELLIKLITGGEEGESGEEKPPGEPTEEPPPAPPADDPPADPPAEKDPTEDEGLPANLFENKDKDKDDKRMDKPAMDAAIKDAVAKAAADTRKAMRELADAERFVRPWVGEITVAMDSAESVYKFALEQSGVKTKGVHPSAFRAMLSLVKKPGEVDPHRSASVAMDASTITSLRDRFPNVARMRVVG